MSIITLTTDIGQQDYLVAAVKGQLYSASDSLTIVDVSHQLSSFNYPQAAYFCSSAFKYFPPGTFHIVLLICLTRSQATCCLPTTTIST